MITLKKNTKWFRLIYSCGESEKIDILCPFIQNELTHAAAEKNIIYLFGAAGSENNERATLSTDLYIC